MICTCESHGAQSLPHLDLAIALRAALGLAVRQSCRPALQDAVEQGGSQHSNAVAIQQLDAPALVRHKVQQPVGVTIDAGTPVQQSHDITDDIPDIINFISHRLPGRGLVGAGPAGLLQLIISLPLGPNPSLSLHMRRVV